MRSCLRCQSCFRQTTGPNEAEMHHHTEVGSLPLIAVRLCQAYQTGANGMLPCWHGRCFRLLGRWELYEMLTQSLRDLSRRTSISRDAQSISRLDDGLPASCPSRHPRDQWPGTAQALLAFIKIPSVLEDASSAFFTPHHRRSGRVCFRCPPHP